MPFQSQTRITHGGVFVDRFSVSDDGPPKHSMVIVPGAMDRAIGWRRLVRFVPNVEVLVFDRRGYHRSLDVPFDLTNRLDDDLLDIDEVCAMCAHEPTLFGHSQGALLAMHHVYVKNAQGMDGAMWWEPPMPWLDCWGDDRAGTFSFDSVIDSNGTNAAERFLVSVIGQQIWDQFPTALQQERRAEAPALIADVACANSIRGRLDLGELNARSSSIPISIGYGSETTQRHKNACRVLTNAIDHAACHVIDGAPHGVQLAMPEALGTLLMNVIAESD